MDLRAIAAALAVGALLSSCGSAGGSDRESRVPVPAGLGTRCPDAATELRLPEGDLRQGATRVRLCPGPPLTDLNGEPTGGDIQAPADLLTTGVGDLVSLVNRQEAVQGDIDCTFDGGPVLAYWFGYPDGDWRAVEFGSYGCNLLSLGRGLRRRGGVELATAFTDALVSQRLGQPAPAGSQQVSCPAWPGAPHSALVLDDVDLAAATWCVSPHPRRVRESAMAADLVQRLNAELWPGLPTKSVRPCGETTTSWIEGRTPWGDAVGYGIDSCGEIHPLHGAWVLHDQERHYVTPELYAALMALPLGPMVEPVALARP